MLTCWRRWWTSRLQPKMNRWLPARPRPKRSRTSRRFARSGRRQRRRSQRRHSRIEAQCATTARAAPRACEDQHRDAHGLRGRDGEAQVLLDAIEREVPAPSAAVRGRAARGSAKGGIIACDEEVGGGGWRALTVAVRLGADVHACLNANRHGKQQKGEAALRKILQAFCTSCAMLKRCSGVVCLATLLLS